MPQAGTAWVPVEPSLRGFSAEIRREVRTLGPFSVPVDPDLDVRGLRAALAALPHIVLDADSTPVDREIMELRARLTELSHRTIGLDISAGQVRAEVASIQRDLDRLAATSPDIGVRVDAGAASAALSGVNHEIARVDGHTARARVDVDTAAAVANVLALTALLSSLAGRTFGMRLDLDTVGAVAGLARVLGLLGLIGGAAGAVGGAAGALAGLGAAGSVAAAGLVPAVLAFLGVGDALSALTAQEKGAAQVAAQSARQQQSAAFSIAAAQDRAAQAATASAQARRDAARSVEAAELSASRSIEAALTTQASAQRQLRTATADLAREQRSLTAAWQDGRRSLQDLADQLDMSLVDQRQARVDLTDATKALQAAQDSGDADAIERAQIAYDRQVETVDQLGKRVERLGADNAAAQAAGVAGTAQVVAAHERITAAADRAGDAQRAAGQAAAAVDRARIDGAAAVAAAREQADQRIAAADQQSIEAQRALERALTQTGDAGSAAANTVAYAFSQLSPAAAGFAMYLWSLRPVLDELSATAASRFFPPLRAGMDTLLTRGPQVRTIVGQLAGAMGAALGLVLTQLASPFWMRFFAMLADASGTVIPALAQTLLTAAGAVAALLGHLMPLVPAALAVLDQFSAWVAMLSPFLAQLLGGLIPAFSALLVALGPLGPLLGALTPILLILAQALSTVLGAALQALTPILVALTPLIQTLATQLAVSLVGAIQSLTPFLIALAGWMSAHPGLVLGLITTMSLAVPIFKTLGLVVGAVAWAFRGWIIMNLVRALLTSLGLSAVTAGGVVAGLGRALAWLGSVLLPKLGAAFTWLLRTMLGALGPIGMVILIFGALFTANEQFRGAVMTLLGVFGQLIGQVVSGLMPIFTALSPILTTVGTVFGGIAAGLATALVPVVTALAAVLQWLTPILVPLLQLFIGVRLAIMAWTVAQWALNVAMAANPMGLLVLAIAALIGAIVWAYQHFDWFRDAVNAVGAAFVWLWQSVIVPAAQGIGAVIQGVWTTLIKPVWDALVWYLRTVVFPVFSFLYENIVKPYLNLVGAVIGLVWATVIKPVFDAMVWLLREVLGPAVSWFYTTVIRPVFDAAGAVIDRVWRSVIKPVFDAAGAGIGVLGDLFHTVTGAVADHWDRLGRGLQRIYDTVIKPVIDAVKGGIEAIGGAVDWIASGVRSITPGGGGPPARGGARGGLVRPMATGGVLPMRADRPTIVAPGTPRLIGDNPVADELFAPLIDSGRTVALMAAGIAQLGPGFLARLLAALLGPTAAATATPTAAAGAGAVPMAQGGILALAGGAVVALPTAATPAAATPATGGGPGSGVGLDPEQVSALTGGVVELDVAVVALTGSVTALSTAGTTLSVTVVEPLTAQVSTLRTSAVVPLTATVQELQATALVPLATWLATVMAPTLAAFHLAIGITAPAQLRLLIAALVATQQTLVTTTTSTQTSTTAMTTALTGLSGAGQTQLGALQTALRTTGQVAAQTATFWRDQIASMRAAAADPIRWIMQFPLGPPGIAASWNSLDDQFRLGKRINPPVPAFAGGGRIVDGLISGPGTATSDSIWALTETSDPLRVSTGEYVMPATRTRAHLPFLEALRAGQPEAVQAAGGRGARGPRRYAAGGLIAAQQFAAAQHGKPYGWGAVGPDAYDCSGLLSAITNVLRGQYPHRRLGVARSQPWPGFLPGLRGAFATGYSAVHTAGTLGGVNVEAGGAPSRTKYGAGAAGADDPQFGGHAWLPEIGGQFVSGGVGGGAAVDPAPLVDGAFARARGLVADITRFFGTSAAVTGLQQIARQAVDAVAARAIEQLRVLFGGLGGYGAGAPFYVAEITRAAKLRGLGVDGATIGTGTALVESNLKMYANRRVPASLGFPHDAIGSDFDSVGLFQQRDNGAWGTVEQRMNPFASAGLFFDALVRRYGPRWRSMPPGDVAQGVQASAYPDRYARRMPEARRLVELHGGRFDTGGLAVGRGLLFKEIITPERVLDPVETRQYDTLGPLVREMEAGRLPQRAQQGVSAAQAAAMAPAREADTGARDLYLFDVNNELIGRMRAEAARETDSGLRRVATQVRQGRRV